MKMEVLVAIQTNRTWPTIPTPASSSSEPRLPENRRRNRLVVKLPVQLQSADLANQKVVEVQMTMNFNRHGLYFETSQGHYRLGMRLQAAFPYCDGLCHEYAGEVVRVESLPDGRYGIAVRFLYIESRSLIVTTRLSSGGAQADR